MKTRDKKNRGFWEGELGLGIRIHMSYTNHYHSWKPKIKGDKGLSMCVFNDGVEKRGHYSR